MHGWAKGADRAAVCDKGDTEMCMTRKVKEEILRKRTTMRRTAKIGSGRRNRRTSSLQKRSISK